ncbi:hypothetical protein [Aureimonas sp. AU40]|uniref:hypothetical protein n=1 Tax=Aureimonas sp. AU40 TaxID=1637747 RepID=UPI00078554A1|nr:hypothetical protein [Aureimonas sp. AU40]
MTNDTNANAAETEFEVTVAADYRLFATTKVKAPSKEAALEILKRQAAAKVNFIAADMPDWRFGDGELIGGITLVAMDHQEETVLEDVELLDEDAGRASFEQLQSMVDTIAGLKSSHDLIRYPLTDDEPAELAIIAEQHEHDTGDGLDLLDTLIVEARKFSIVRPDGYGGPADFEEPEAETTS